MNARERKVFEQLYAACDELAEDCRWRTLDETMIDARAELDKCERCDGTGREGVYKHYTDRDVQIGHQTCPACNGTGKRKET